ncbi:MAG: hypothetical protein UV59_C0003G0031 [Candidatus Gottesmanbacteria bacterium GW2011_GWA1_43_11]|uniref:Cohesin domain-containing protein n=1 Tax=Candidatus Gottesmanbacteria bacterium GW2011_GWA1_43_11 TaxID=1618436 RepID=A0A0G1ESJ4_9BACT|nr:MAG: hypothetical protein UV59_C0003G0031 [Candidatus Gottesmanbacteria bacterium GW2011_GWA1_43_11]
MFLVHAKPVQAARLLFSPETMSLTQGETVSVGLLLDPEGEAIIGTDVFLQFDPRFLELAKIEKTNTFPNQYALTINNQTGRAKFALVHPLGSYTRAYTKIAEVFVKGKSPVSSTVLAFNFTGATSTNDSNVVVDKGRDVLRQAQGAVFTINPVPGASQSVDNTSNTDDTDSDSTDIASDTEGEVAGGTTTTNVAITVPPPSGQVLSFPEASNTTIALTNEPDNQDSTLGKPGAAGGLSSPVAPVNPFAKNQGIGLLLLLVGLVLTYIVIRLVRAYLKRKEESLASDVSA